MPMVKVGNVPYRGTGPLKYVNAEIAGIRVSWPGGAKTVENGGVVEVPAAGDYEVTVSLLNTGESEWLPGGNAAKPGECVLRTSAGDAAIGQKVERFGKASAGALRVAVGQQSVELTGRMAAADRGAFGETLKVVLRPGRAGGN
jgi:hypothetical protein